MTVTQRTFPPARIVKLGAPVCGGAVMKYALALPIGLILLAGCVERQPMTVSDFLANEVALYGTLTRCQSDPAAGTDPECRNARQAAERISVIEERAMRKAREEAFTSAREEYRTRLDRERNLRIKAEREAEEARLQALLNALDTTPAEPLADPADPAEAVEAAGGDEAGDPGAATGD
jgi:hypothetical protein